MAKYINKSLGVVNVAGQFAAPKQELDVPESSPGLKNLLKAGILEEVRAKPGRPKKNVDDSESADEGKE